MYPKELITSIEAEMTTLGFIPLKTAEEVTQHFSDAQGTTLVFVNSMCGCAGPDARLGIKEALAHTTNHQPDHLITVFPGIDEEATVALQTYLKPYPLTAPSIALLKAGEVVYYMERYQIKGVPAEKIMEALVNTIKHYC